MASSGLISTFPVIDLKDADLYGQGRKDIIQQIAKASEEYGFFQVINHGVPEELMDSMMRVATEFFEMPLEHRARFYLKDKDKPASCSSFYLDKEKSIVLLDSLRHYCNPLEDVISFWPQKPEKYREVAAKYSLEVKLLAMKLYGLLCEALGLETCYVEKKFGEQTMTLRTNYCPPCMNPGVTVGIKQHIDPDGLTILLLRVPGLQLIKDGKWIDVEAVPNALAINVGTHLQVVSNGRFISPIHRAIVNSSVTRTSVLLFFTFPTEAYVAPAESLVNEDNPARYRGYSMEEFLKVYWTIDISESILDHFQL